MKILKLWSITFHSCYFHHFEPNHHSLQMASQELHSLSWTFCEPIFQHSMPLA
jgi:hypothetical protein